jgi:hypothetical protein
VLLLCCLMGTGCSIVGTVYGQLDRLIVMQADRWLALDDGQEAALREAVVHSVERHRSEELPGWIALLHALADLVESGEPAEGDMLAAIEQARSLVERSTHLLLRPAAEILARLEPRQLEHLAQALEEDNDEYAEEFLDPSPERRANARVERTREAIERWSGRLDAAQRDRVEALMAAVPDGAEAWRDYRHAWQDALLGHLHAGVDAGAIEQLLQDWWIGDAGMHPDYLAQLARNRQTIAQGLAGLVTALSPAQRQRAVRRLRDTAGELEEVAGAGA